MKRYGNLYDKICEMSNLELAFTNSAVIARQLEQYAEYLPFETVIKKFTAIIRSLRRKIDYGWLSTTFEHERRL